VTFALNQSPPTAHAGSNQTVTEGDTVTLDGSQSSDPDDAVVRYEWTRLSGPTAALSDENAVNCVSALDLRMGAARPGRDPAAQ